MIKPLYIFIHCAQCKNHFSKACESP